MCFKYKPNSNFIDEYGLSSRNDTEIVRPRAIDDTGVNPIMTFREMTVRELSSQSG